MSSRARRGLRNTHMCIHFRIARSWSLKLRHNQQLEHCQTELELAGHLSQQRFEHPSRYLMKFLRFPRSLPEKIKAINQELKLESWVYVASGLTIPTMNVTSQAPTPTARINNE